MCALINICLGANTKAEKYLEKVALFSQDTFHSFIKKDSIELLPLNTGSRFSKKFGLIEFPDFSRVSFRPAIRLPRMQPPLQIDDSFDMILQMIKYESVHPRPEIPWLNKVNECYQFTQSILLSDCDNVSEQNKSSNLLKVFKSQQVFRKKSSFMLANGPSKDNLKDIINQLKENLS